MATSAAVVETTATAVVVASPVVGEVAGAPAEGAAGSDPSVHPRPSIPTRAASRTSAKTPDKHPLAIREHPPPPLAGAVAGGCGLPTRREGGRLDLVCVEADEPTRVGDGDPR